MLKAKTIIKVVVDISVGYSAGVILRECVYPKTNSIVEKGILYVGAVAVTQVLNTKLNEHIDNLYDGLESAFKNS